MAWRIHIKSPQARGSNYTHLNALASPETLTMGYGSNAVTLFRQGGEDWWYKCDGFWPELPAELSGTVTKVTFVGAPPTHGITPGLYEEDDGSSTVERNGGEKLRVELTAKSIESARSLWRKVLQNEGSIRTVAYTV